MRRSPKERHSANQACRCKGPCHCDGQCVGPCPCDHTAVDLHVELHTHLDRALRCMDRIQSLEAAESVASLGETDGSWKLPDSLAKMKNKAMEKLKQMKERLSGKKKKKESEEEEEQDEQPASQQGAPANFYLVHERG